MMHKFPEKGPSARALVAESITSKLQGGESRAEELCGVRSSRS